MAAAALLSIAVVPALMILFVRGRFVPEHKNSINRFLIWIYRPIIRGVLNAKALTIGVAFAILAVSIWPATRLGSEFMPSLNEGTILPHRSEGDPPGLARHREARARDRGGDLPRGLSPPCSCRSCSTFTMRARHNWCGQTEVDRAPRGEICLPISSWRRPG